MKLCRPSIQNYRRQYHIQDQFGYTLIELMIAIAISGILVATALVSYHMQVRKTQVMTIHNGMNYFRLPYQVLMDDNTGVTDFSANDLNMLAHTKYCQFTVAAPIANSTTPDAIICNIQNLSYLEGPTLSLDYTADGNWKCKASTGIRKAYLLQACQ